MDNRNQQVQNDLMKLIDHYRGSRPVDEYMPRFISLLFLKFLSDNPIDELGMFNGLIWSDLRKQLDNVGITIDKGLKNLSTQSKNLAYLDALANFEKDDNKELVDLVSTVSNIDFETVDAGKLCSSIIHTFAQALGKRGAEHYDPPELSQLLIELLKPAAGSTVHDPACGAGGTLVASLQYIAKHSEKQKNQFTVELSGQEINRQTAALCTIHLYMNGSVDHKIRLEDTLNKPLFVVNNKLDQFDIVVGSPPFNVKNVDDFDYDVYDRYFFGSPPRSNSDFAFIQHGIAAINKNGRGAFIVPHGVLFRGAAEAKIRKGIIRADLIEAIIGLPANLFYATGIPLVILIFNKAKLKEQQDKILFIDASKLSETQNTKSRSYLTEDAVKKIVNAYDMYIDQPNFAKVVSYPEIAAQDYSLSINRYMHPAEGFKASFDLEKEYLELKMLTEKADASKKALDTTLTDLMSYLEID